MMDGGAHETEERGTVAKSAGESGEKLRNVGSPKRRSSGVADGRGPRPPEVGGQPNSASGKEPDAFATKHDALKSLVARTPAADADTALRVDDTVPWDRRV